MTYTKEGPTRAKVSNRLVPFDKEDSIGRCIEVVALKMQSRMDL